MSALRASLGSRCRTYDWSIGLPASVQNKNAVRLLNNYPAPNYTGNGGNFNFNVVQPSWCWVDKDEIPVFIVP